MTATLPRGAWAYYYVKERHILTCLNGNDTLHPCVSLAFGDDGHGKTLEKRKRRSLMVLLCPAFDPVRYHIHGYTQSPLPGYKRSSGGKVKGEADLRALAQASRIRRMRERRTTPPEQRQVAVGNWQAEMGRPSACHASLMATTLPRPQTLA